MKRLSGVIMLWALLIVAVGAPIKSVQASPGECTVGADCGPGYDCRGPAGNKSCVPRR